MLRHPVKPTGTLHIIRGVYVPPLSTEQADDELVTLPCTAVAEYAVSGPQYFLARRDYTGPAANLLRRHADKPKQPDAVIERHHEGMVHWPYGFCHLIKRCL